MRRRRRRAARRPVSVSTVAVTCAATPSRACAKIATTCSAAKRRQAGLDQSLRGGLVGEVDELDLATGRLGEGCGDLRVGDGFGAGQGVRPAVVAGRGENGRRGGADVAGIDHRDPRLARRRAELALESHGLGGGEQVRHEEARAEDHRGDAESFRCCSIRPCQSQNATGAPGRATIEESLTIRRTPRFGRRVDRGRLPLDPPRIVGAREEERLGAVERGAQRARLGEVAGARGRPRRRRGRAPCPGRARTRARPVRCSSRARTTCEPAIPVAPVTRIISPLLSSDDSGKLCFTVYNYGA